MAAQATGLLPGQSAPLTIITDTDRTGVVLIVTALAMSFALVSLFIRGYVRYEFSPLRYASDDAVITVAMIFAILQSTTVFIAVSKGFGKTIKDISPSALVELQKSYYASDILYIITLYLTKASVVFLFLRLSPNRRHMLVSKLILIASTVLGVISIMIIALRCDLAQPWITINAKCTGLFARWQVVAAFDTITEVALFAMSIYIMHGLQMAMRKKMVVVMAFGFRLPVIIALAFRLFYVHRQIQSRNPTLDIIASICTQTEMNYAIIAATIPCLRPFMTATATNYGAPASTKHSVYATAKSHTKSRNIFSLASMSSRLDPSRAGMQQTNKSQISEEVPPVAQQPYHSGQLRDVEASKTALKPDQHSIGSTESKEMFIRKDIQYAVEYEGSKSAR